MGSILDSSMKEEDHWEQGGIQEAGKTYFEISQLVQDWIAWRKNVAVMLHWSPDY